MQVIRLLIYEGSPEVLHQQLGRSMGDGQKPGMKGCIITAITLGSVPAEAAIANLLKREESD